MTRGIFSAQLGALMLVAAVGLTYRAADDAHASEALPPVQNARENPVLDWNEILIESLVETNTANSMSQRLCAIVHTAMFDAENSISGRYAPIHVRQKAPRGTSSHAAIVAAAYTTLVNLFPSRAAQLEAHYAESTTQPGGATGTRGRSHQQGLEWGAAVARSVLEWRATDGFSGSYEPFLGGTDVGQWRPTPPAFSAMSAQALAFTRPFVLSGARQFEPGPPRGLDTAAYAADVHAVQTLGRNTGSTRTADQTALAPFWEGNASVHWNQAANQIAHAAHVSVSESNHLFAALNLAMADTAITVWAAKRHYGATPQAVTWRPVTSIPLADADQNDATMPESGWAPLVVTPSHPEYPAGHPALNGAAATVLLRAFPDQQAFTLTTRTANGELPPRSYASITRARSDGNQARVWGGMHYPSTVAISDALGAAIAHFIVDHSMQPLRDNGAGPSRGKGRD